MRASVIPEGGVASLKPCSTAVVLGDDDVHHSSAGADGAGAADGASAAGKDNAFVGACGGLFFALEVRLICERDMKKYDEMLTGHQNGVHTLYYFKV